jgi:hypothetical protein
MKRNPKTVLIITASSLLLAGCCTTRYAATQWEYKVVRYEGGAPNLGDAKLGAKLTGLGSEGWELVSWNEASWVFKRPKK